MVSGLMGKSTRTFRSGIFGCYRTMQEKWAEVGIADGRRDRSEVGSNCNILAI